MVTALHFASGRITPPHHLLFSYRSTPHQGLFSFLVCLILSPSCAHSILHLWRCSSYLKTSLPFAWLNGLWWTLHADEPQCMWHTGTPHTPHRNQLPQCCRHSSYKAEGKKRTSAPFACNAIKWARTELFLRCYRGRHHISDSPVEQKPVMKYDQFLHVMLCITCPYFLVILQDSLLVINGFPIQLHMWIWCGSLARVGYHTLQQCTGNYCDYTTHSNIYIFVKT